MQVSVQHQSLAGRLAENLLKAWLSADAVKVRTELERSIAVPVEAHDTFEQERRQLLQAVANRMRKCPGLFEPRRPSPEVDLYTHLLFNLSLGARARN